MNWVASNAYSGVPPNAVVAGNDIDGATIYVGRAHHEGDLIPAKVIPSKQVAYVAWGGQEVAKHDFHVRQYILFSSNSSIQSKTVRLKLNNITFPRF